MGLDTLSTFTLRCAVSVALVQFLTDLIPHLIALCNLRLFCQFVHDGIDELLQRLLQITVLLLAAGGFQRLHELAHILLDDRIVADLMLHTMDEVTHSILRRFHQILVRNIFPLIDLVHLITEDGIGQLRAHGCDPILGQVTFLRVIRPDHHVDVRMMTFIVESGIPSEVIKRYLH